MNNDMVMWGIVSVASLVSLLGGSSACWWAARRHEASELRRKEQIQLAAVKAMREAHARELLTLELHQQQQLQTLEHEREQLRAKVMMLVHELDNARDALTDLLQYQGLMDDEATPDAPAAQPSRQSEHLTVYGDCLDACLAPY